MKPNFWIVDTRSKRSLACTLVATCSLPLPAMRKQVARESASSQACVAPLPEVGRKECALSPNWMTRPPREAHSGWGSRQRRVQSTALLGGIRRSIARMSGSQSANVSTMVSADTDALQDSLLFRSFSYSELSSVYSSNMTDILTL